MKMRINLEREGLESIFKPYQINILRFLWESDGPRRSYDVWQGIGSEDISRASVINSLNDMSELGFLEKTEETGKGGHRGLYRSAMVEREILVLAGNTALDRLGRFGKRNPS